ncbi:MAG: fibronectin type III domain-containing protein [Acidimicrobiia bacterium]
MFARLRERLGSSSGVATTGAAFVLAVGSVAALGVGFDKTVMDMLDGGAWLANDGRGSVTHVNGDSGEADAAIKFLGLDGHELQVIDGPDGTYVLDLTTGTLYRIDTANLGEATSQAGVGSGVDVVVGSGVAYVVDMKSGKVTPMDPFTLTPSGETVEIGAPLTRGVIDSDGRLWVAVPSRGDAVAVRGDRVETTMSVAGGGDDLEPSIVGGEAVVVNRSRAQVVRVGRGDVTPVPLDVASGAPLRVPRGGPDSVLRVVDPAAGVLVEKDLSSGRSQRTDLGRKGNGLGAPEAAGGRTYVPDETAGDVVVCRDGGVEESFGVTESKPGRIQTSRSGPNLYFNDPASSRSVAVDGRGRRHDVDKYRPDIATNEQPTDPATNQPEPPKPPPPRPKPPGQPTRGTAPPPTQPAPGAPPAPTPTQTAAGDAKATLSWTQASDGGSPITGFRVRAQPGGREVAVGGNSRQATVEGLTNDTTYTLTIWATNQAGESPAAQSAPVTPHPSIPGAPKAVSVDQPQRPEYSGKVKVTWGPPDAHDATISGYDVVPTVNGKTDKAKTVHAAATDTTIDVDGLAPGAKVSVTVAARYQNPTAGGAVLTGSPSTPTKPITVGGPPEITNLRADAFGDRGIKVDWDVADFGAKVTNCGVIQLDNRSDHPGCGHYEAGGYAYSTQYWFTAYAENAFGRTTKDIQSTPTNGKPTWTGTVDFTYGGTGCPGGSGCTGNLNSRPAYVRDGPIVRHGDRLIFECWTGGDNIKDWASPAHSSALWFKLDGQGWYYGDLWFGRTGDHRGLPQC